MGVEAGEGGVCRGMVRTRWFDAEEGVRRSKSRKRESEDTALRRDGEVGWKVVE